MNRRTTLKSLLALSAGATLLSSCLQEKSESSTTWKNLKISGKEEALVAELSETIIPKTDTPGAKDVGAHLFTLMMVDDCYSGADQEKFVKGLKAFENLVDKKFDKSFVKSSVAERTQVLSDIQNKKDVSEDAAFFYSTVKRYTLQAYTTSEYFLTKVQPYKLVPGEFYGCVPLKKAS